ncbi:hypothetical protein LTR12_013893 [Friedmanniomyces endolithicus]|nr:hypothetical protein LTR12_013893 [Friedmanniomyces endolithicus]
MAVNLRSKIPQSERLVVFDTNRAVSDKLAEQFDGVEVANTAREVAEKSATIVTVLPRPQHVQSVIRSMLQPTKLPLDGLDKQRLFIDCSTIDPGTSGAVAEEVKSSGQGDFIDAPMSGGAVGARDATLTFMVGASEELKDRVHAVLIMLGKKIVFVGPQTSGVKAKLANNYILAIANIGAAEAMRMAMAWNIDINTLTDIINSSTGRCWPTEVNHPVPGIIQESPSSRGYNGGFATALMNKDLNLALMGAAQAGFEPSLGRVAHELYCEVEKDEEMKNQDCSVMYKFLGGR